MERQVNRRVRQLASEIGEALVTRQRSLIEYTAGHNPGQYCLLRHLQTELSEAAQAIDDYLTSDGMERFQDDLLAKEIGRELGDVFFALAAAHAFADRNELNLKWLITHELLSTSGVRTDYTARQTDGGPADELLMELGKRRMLSDLSSTKKELNEVPDADVRCVPDNTVYLKWGAHEFRARRLAEMEENAGARGEE